MSDGQWDWITRSGNWKRMYAGVYRRVGAPRTWEQALMAGCLAVDGIASHQAAGTLWRLPEVEQRLEITIPQSRRVSLKGFRVHHTCYLQPVDRGHRAGIPVTSLARTVIDVSLALLFNRLDALGTKGRRGAGALFDFLQECKGRKRHVDSGLQRRLERIVLDAARAGLLPDPQFEYAVLMSDGNWRYPDVAFPHVRIGFEAQSYEHHSTLAAFARDQARNLELFGEGWFIVPITEVEIRDPVRLVTLMARIIAAAEARRA